MAIDQPAFEIFINGRANSVISGTILISKLLTYQETISQADSPHLL